MEPAAQDVIEGNPIGELMELCVKRKIPLPTYEDGPRTGPSHVPSFVAVCSVDSIREEGFGKSKKEAKKQAAHKVLQKVRQQQQQNQPTGDVEMGSAEDHQQQPINNTNVGNQQQAGDMDHSFMRMAVNLQDRPESQLFRLQTQTSEEDATYLRSEAVEILETIGKEEGFGVTFVDRWTGVGGTWFVTLQLGTTPAIVCCGKGSTEEGAKYDAAFCALEFLRHMTKPIVSPQNE
jgi:RISC-loading complex subunit TARBP2